MEHAELKALVDEFVTLVTLGRSLDAIERFYAVDSTMQENLNAPCRGKKACLAAERTTLEQLSEPPHAQALAVALDLERAVALIHWRVTEHLKTGAIVGLDRIAIQQWRDGAIGSERYVFERAMDLTKNPDRDAFGEPLLHLDRARVMTHQRQASST
jgi:hypothetical protein